MKKIYHLATCSTCQRILKELNADKKAIALQDIKTEKITAPQLNEMKKLAGSYEALFSKRAIKYKELGLAKRKLTDEEMRRYILDEYTFLKRPVAIINNKIFIGNSPSVVKDLKQNI